MPLYDYFVIDTFADSPFTGNPAGVVLNASSLTDDQMQAIAREIYLSETVFVLGSTQPNAAVRFRTFTPTAEMRVSGHSVLAGVAALIRVGRFVALLEEPGTLLPIETLSGLLTARVERIRRGSDEFLVWLDLARPLLKKFPHASNKTAGLLGLDPTAVDDSMPAMKTQDDDVILFVQNLPALLDARPDFAALADVSRKRGVRAWCTATLETLAGSVSVHSRCFAPVAGVNEDPVSANVHGPLATYLVVAGQVGMAGGKAAVTCIQTDSTGRAGLVRVLVAQQQPNGYQAWIGGRCFVAMTGQIHVPS